jgi:hypothetical protein
MQKKTYTQEFKREVVRLAQTSGKPIAKIAHELGISDTSIHQWRKVVLIRSEEYELLVSHDYSRLSITSILGSTRVFRG